MTPVRVKSGSKTSPRRVWSACACGDRCAGQVAAHPEAGAVEVAAVVPVDASAVAAEQLACPAR